MQHLSVMPHPDHAIARLALKVFADLDALRTCPGPGLPRRGIDLTVTRRRDLGGLAAS